MKIIGIDYGDMRTGIAMSDINEFLASSYTTVEGHNAEKVAARIIEIIKKENVHTAVLGLPKNMDGSSGARVERTYAFAEILKSDFDGEIVFVDERLTTVSAAGFLNETNTRGKKRKAVIDRLAAELILQSYLDAKRR